MPTILFTFSRDGRRHFATDDRNERFLVANEVVYQGNHGLANSQIINGQVYDPLAAEPTHGFWSWFIYSTAMCESKGSFHCLNTYDRAAFTFGFMQYAAHVANGDFVLFFRRLLQLPEAKDYFPFLELRDNRIWYKRDATLTQLETGTSSKELMKYLNPDAASVDTQELVCSARFVHWSQHSRPHRNLQVQTAIEHFKESMRINHQRYNLDGWPDKICQAICDIHHQGRAKVVHIVDILRGTSNRETIYKNLMNVGIETYEGRVRTLKAAHKKMINEGRFGKVYNAQSGEFV
jgi:hypothetical protein